MPYREFKHLVILCRTLIFGYMLLIYSGDDIMDFNDELDAKGLNCPLPILRAKKAVNKLDAGQVLKIIATDPGSVKDFEAFCNQTGNKLLESTENGGEFTFYIEKA